VYIARVSGTVVATFKHKVLEGRKLLVVDRLDLKGQAGRDYTIAVDVVQAGVGDLVLVMDEGSSARQILDLENAPIRALVVGIIDQLDLMEGA
jgi:ethanolamine utilization protein EutN